MRKVCFVTPELAPFSKGGIGVLIQNLLQAYGANDVEFAVLATDHWGIDDAAFAQVFPNVKLWRVADLQTNIPHPAVNPPEWAFTSHPWHYKSYQASQALINLERQGVVFDVVEFPDWGGLGFCTCQEKLLGRFSATSVAIRLHSTDSILRAGQPVAGSAMAANLSDLERKSLRDADVIVAHLSSIITATKDHFGFDGKWLEKCIVNAPPIAVDTVKSAIKFDVDTTLCFPSKIQQLKGPEIFLKGVLGFLNSVPEYNGSVSFLAFEADQDLKKKLRQRIDGRFKDRISFVANAPQPVRDAIIRSSISIFPSPFESFCLAAYEASAKGGIVILNRNNPAFNDETVWQEGINCLKFDGTSSGLIKCLVDAWRGRAVGDFIPVKQVPEQSPYWKAALPKTVTRKSARKGPHNQPLVTVIVPYFNMGRYIYRTIESISASTYPNIEIIIVDDCSTDIFSNDVLEKLKSVKKFEYVKVISNVVNLGLSATRNAGIRAANGSFILPLDSDDLIHPKFIEIAVRALMQNPEYSLVVPQTAYVNDAATAAELDVIDYALFTGEAIRGGVFSNRFSTATTLGRKSVFEELPYDENLSSYEDWDFYSRAVNRGARCIVTNDVYFYYRRRAGSMIAGNTEERHRQNISIIRSKQSVTIGAVAMDMNIVTDAEGVHEEKLNAARSALTSSSLNPESTESYVNKLRALIAHQEALLRESREKNNAISEVIRMLRSSERAEDGTSRDASIRNPRPQSYLVRMLQRIRMRAEIKALVQSGEFDPHWYLDNYRDVAAEKMDPAVHYILYGKREGRKANGKESL